MRLTPTRATRAPPGCSQLPPAQVEWPPISRGSVERLRGFDPLALSGAVHRLPQIAAPLLGDAMGKRQTRPRVSLGLETSITFASLADDRPSVGCGR